MALVGFPDKIKVVLGSAWTGQSGLSPATMLILEDTGSAWTENGTTTANPVSNRLQFSASTAFGRTAFVWAPRLNITTSIFGSIGYAAIFDSLDYEFLDIWSGTPSFQQWLGGGPSGYISGFLSANAPYNPDIFSTLQAAVAGDLNILEGETAIPDGTTTPRDFGSVLIDAAPPQKTFTLENLGDLEIAITSITVPEGYEIDASSDLDGGADAIAGGASKTLIVNLLTTEAGTFAGDIEINSDDADEATYNFAVTGVVTAQTTATMVADAELSGSFTVTAALSAIAAADTEAADTFTARADTFAEIAEAAEAAAAFAAVTIIPANMAAGAAAAAEFTARADLLATLISDAEAAATFTSIAALGASVSADAEFSDEFAVTVVNVVVLEAAADASSTFTCSAALTASTVFAAECSADFTARADLLAAATATAEASASFAIATEGAVVLEAGVAVAGDFAARLAAQANATDSASAYAVFGAKVYRRATYADNIVAAVTAAQTLLTNVNWSETAVSRATLQRTYHTHASILSVATLTDMMNADSGIVKLLHESAGLVGVGRGLVG